MVILRKAHVVVYMFMCIVILWCKVTAKASQTHNFRAQQLLRVGLSRSLTSACTPMEVRNGKVIYRSRSSFAKFKCNPGYLLVGERYVKCIHYKWEGIAPKCVRNTCGTIKSPANGLIYPSHRGGVLNFFCRPGYKLHGPQTVHCDGLSWSSYLPACIATNTTPSLQCDFESEDLCGWTHDINHDFDWTRMKYGDDVSSGHHVATGPRHDHTLGKNGEGHYMYIEASTNTVNETARLISPVYQPFQTTVGSDGDNNYHCLEYYYHMGGEDRGQQLRVYLHRVSRDWNLTMADRLMEFTAQEGSGWRKAVINLSEDVKEDFQIIFEGIRGDTYVSEIAIDDVNITENCRVESDYTTAEYESTSNYDDTFIRFQSCTGRCYGDAHNPFASDLFFIIACSCEESCLEDNTCCPDFTAVCILGATEDYGTSAPEIFDTSTDYTSPDLMEIATEDNYSTDNDDMDNEIPTVEDNSNSKIAPPFIEKITENPKKDEIFEPTKSNLELSTQKSVIIPIPKPNSIPIIPNKNSIIPNKTPVIPNRNQETSNNIPVIPNKQIPPYDISKSTNNENTRINNQNTLINDQKTTKKIPILPPKNNQIPSKNIPLIPINPKTSITKKVPMVPNSTKKLKPTTNIPTRLDDYATLPNRLDEGENPQVELIPHLTTTRSGEKTSKLPVKQSYVNHSGSKDTNSDGFENKYVIIGVVIFAVVGIMSTRCLVKKYAQRTCHGYRAGNSHSESTSDVRFLTSDEVLDFNVARPDDYHTL